jgi:hypothetical protein
MDVWELNKGAGIALADVLCDLGEGMIILAEGFHDWRRRDVPLLNYTMAFSLRLRKIMEKLSQVSQVVKNYSLRRLGCLLR